jgi:hypothetical protein
VLRLRRSLLGGLPAGLDPDGSRSAASPGSLGRGVRHEHRRELPDASRRPASERRLRPRALARGPEA